MSAHKNVKRIGRTLGQSTIASMIDGGANSRIFTLRSGQPATFVRQVIPHSELEKMTYVDSLVNGRDQSMLTAESVKDISRTITLQQFFPAIGRLSDGRIEIMDGSRRRASCLFMGADLEILVTSDDISIADARQLAADIQTAREHNLRELGLRFAILNQNGMSKSDIAKSEGISNAKVSRAFQAASVPAEIIELFPVVSELTLPDYQLLLDVAEEAKAEGVAIDTVVTRVQSNITDAGQRNDATADEIKAELLGYFRAVKRQLKIPVSDKQVITEKLATFDDRNAYARRKTNTVKRTVHYEFSRLPKEMADKIDAVIKDILSHR